MLDFEREPVPLTHRRTWFSFVVVYLAIGIDLSAMILGTELGRGLPLVDAMLAIALGSLLLALIAGICANVGTTTGLSTAMIAESAFGRQGAKFISAFLGLSLIGWFGVQAGFFGVSGTYALQVFGVNVVPALVTAVGGFLMTLTAVFGYRALERLSRFSVPLMLILLVVALIRALGQTEGETRLMAATTDQTMSFGQAVSFVIGVFITGAAISPDLSRWARTKRDGFWGTFVGFFVGNSVMLVAAVLLTTSTGANDIVAIFAKLGLALWAILILTLGQWTTNSGNLYSATLSLSVLIRKAPRIALAFLGGAVGTALAVGGLYDSFTTFLSFITAFVAPVAGVYLAEFYLLANPWMSGVAGGRTPPRVIPRAFCCWLVGTWLVLCTTPSGEGGLGWFQLTHVPALDGIFVAGLVQYLSSLIPFSRRQRIAAESSKPC